MANGVHPARCIVDLHNIKHRNKSFSKKKSLQQTQRAPLLTQPPLNKMYIEIGALVNPDLLQSLGDRFYGLAIEHDISDLILSAGSDVVRVSSSTFCADTKQTLPGFDLSDELKADLTRALSAVCRDPEPVWDQAWLRIKGHGKGTERHSDRYYVESTPSLAQQLAENLHVATVWILLKDLDPEKYAFQSRLKFDGKTCCKLKRAGDGVVFDIDQVHEATAGRLMSTVGVRISFDLRFVHRGFIP